LKTLIVEDDFTSRILLQKILEQFGVCHVAVDGREAILAYKIALDQKESYDLICLDIMMPTMDGQTTLKEIRKIEGNRGIVGLDKQVRIIMTTSLDDKKNIMESFRSQSDAYMVKPIEKSKLIVHLHDFGLIEDITV